MTTGCNYDRTALRLIAAMHKGARLARSEKPYIIDGEEWVDVYFESNPENKLCMCSPEKADKIVAIYNGEE